MDIMITSVLSQILHTKTEAATNIAAAAVASAWEIKRESDLRVYVERSLASTKVQNARDQFSKGIVCHDAEFDAL